VPEESDHLLRALRADGEPAGSYDLRGWDIRFTTSDGLGSDDVTAAHEQMHAVLTEHTAWGSILKTALEEHRLHPGPGTARRLALFTDACRQTQEALATYVSLAHRVPAELAAYSRDDTSFAYRHYLDLALQLAPDLPPLSPRRTVILTAACWVAMQPAAVLPALESGPAFPLSAVELRHRPDVRLRAIASPPPQHMGPGAEQPLDAADAAGPAAVGGVTPGLPARPDPRPSARRRGDPQVVRVPGRATAGAGQRHPAMG
jgi:hypothetical protein